MTQETYNTFELKDVCRKSEKSCDSPRVMNSSLQLQTPSNVSDKMRHDLLQNHPQSSRGGVTAASRQGDGGCCVGVHGTQDGSQHQG